MQTIFSFAFYHRLAKATKGAMFWFAVYILLLCVVVFNLYVNRYVDKRLPLLLKNFPEVTFTKGVLTAPDTPVSVKVPQTDFQLVFDNAAQFPPTREEFLHKRILMFVHQDKVYMPAAAGVQSQRLPEQLNFTTSQEFLDKNESSLKNIIGAVAFMSSFLMIPAMMLFAFCLAGSVGLFWRAVLRKNVPVKTVLKWAVFMWGPVSALWMINLFVPIPLFSLAVFIVCIIYMQQILNTYPEEN